METILVALIQQLTGAVFVLVALLIIAFYAFFKVGSIVTYFKETKEKNDKIDGKVDNIKDSLSSIKATTELLYQAHLKTIGSASPVNLTALGKEVAQAVSVSNKVANHWEEIRKRVEAKNPQNPYDIQVVSMSIAQKCFDEIFTADEKSEIKTYAYNKGMNLLEIYPVIGIEIRDKILRERGIEPAEIDKHAPKNP